MQFLNFTKHTESRFLEILLSFFKWCLALCRNFVFHTSARKVHNITNGGNGRSWELGFSFSGAGRLLTMRAFVHAFKWIRTVSATCYHGSAPGMVNIIPSSTAKQLQDNEHSGNIKCVIIWFNKFHLDVRCVLVMPFKSHNTSPTCTTFCLTLCSSWLTYVDQIHDPEAVFTYNETFPMLQSSCPSKQIKN